MCMQITSFMSKVPWVNRISRLLGPQPLLVYQTWLIVYFFPKIHTLLVTGCTQKKNKIRLMWHWFSCNCWYKASPCVQLLANIAYTTELKVQLLLHSSLENPFIHLWWRQEERIQGEWNHWHFLNASQVHSSTSAVVTGNKGLLRVWADGTES